MNPLRIFIALLAASLLVGCQSGGGPSSVSAGPMQQRTLRGSSVDAVLAEGAAILRREFPRVRIDPETRSISADPVEFVSARDTGLAREVVGGRSTMRRKAMMIVGERGDAVVVRLRIDVERRDTERQKVAQPRGYRLGDTPGAESPIDEDAATTVEQNTVWTPLRRDARLERELLEELRSKFDADAIDVGEDAVRPESAPAPTRLDDADGSAAPREAGANAPRASSPTRSPDEVMEDE